MKRRLLNIVAWMSLALAVTTCWLILRGGIHIPRFMEVPGTKDWMFIFAGGGRFGSSLQFNLIHRIPNPVYSGFDSPILPGSTSQPAYGQWIASLPHSRYFDALGFALIHTSQTGTDVNRHINYYGRRWDLRIPFWAIILGSLGIFGWIKGMPLARDRWKYRAGQRELIEKGLICGNCGYDLQATPDRCPECGTIPPMRKSASAI